MSTFSSAKTGLAMAILRAVQSGLSLVENDKWF